MPNGFPLPEVDDVTLRHAFEAAFPQLFDQANTVTYSTQWVDMQSPSTQYTILLEALARCSGQSVSDLLRVAVKAADIYPNTRLRVLTGVYDEEAAWIILARISVQLSVTYSDAWLCDCLESRGILHSRQSVQDCETEAVRGYFGAQYRKLQAPIWRPMIWACGGDPEALAHNANPWEIACRLAKSNNVIAGFQILADRRLPSWSTLLREVEIEVGAPKLKEALERYMALREPTQSMDPILGDFYDVLRQVYGPAAERFLKHKPESPHVTFDLFRAAVAKVHKIPFGTVNAYCVNQRIPAPLRLALQDLWGRPVGSFQWSNVIRVWQSLGYPYLTDLMCREIDKDTPQESTMPSPQYYYTPKEQPKPMTTISNQKSTTPVKTTYEIIKKATVHGAKVASADEAANLVLELAAVILPEQAAFLSVSDNGKVLLKYLTASALIGLIEAGALPLDNLDGLKAAATLVIEAAARDGIQPIMAKATPILAKLAAEGKRLAETAG